MGRSDGDVRVAALLAARASGDAKLAELVEQALGAMEPGRCWRSSRWRPTSAELATKLGDQYQSFRSPGVTMELIDPDDRRDTLSGEEVRRMRVDRWDRVWSYLAGIPTPVMGWRVNPTGTLYLFLVSAEPEAQERWRAVWEARGPRPADVLRGGNPLLPLFAAPDGSGFGMATIEPGTPARSWRSELEKWSAEGRGGQKVRRIACEVRADDGRMVWRHEASASRRDSLLVQAERQVARHLLRRKNERLDAYPAHLACWLLKTGHGRLSAIEGRTYAHVAQVVLGAPPGMSAIADEDRREWRAVRAHVAAAKRLIGSRPPSIQVSHR